MWFVGLGRRLLTYLSEDDGVIQKKEGYLPGSTTTVHGKKVRTVWNMGQGRSFWDRVTSFASGEFILDDHGAPLQNEEVHSGISEAIGLNLAAPR